MRYLVSAVAATTALAFLAPAVQAEEIDWIPTLEKGVAEAKRSGRSILYITLWSPGT